MYNMAGEKPAYCGEHRKEGMVNVMKPSTCKEEGCMKSRAYGVKGGKAEYCSAHRKEGMERVMAKLCATDGCDKNAVYGVNVPEYCTGHRKEGMKNLKIKYCAEEGCMKSASHSSGGGPPKYCGEHKTAGMENVVTRRCGYEGCKKFNAVYGIKGSKKRYCAEHKTDEMALIAEGKKCSVEGCTHYGVFKNEDDPKKYCGKHRSAGMKSILNRMCEMEGCEVYASFDVKGGSGRFCLAHKEDGMINVVLRAKIEKSCVSCGLQMKLNKEGKCEYCRPATFKAARLAKQNALMEYLDARELIGSVTDKAVEGGMCGKERPDRVFDFGDKVVILECDENQHKERERDCEVARMKNIGQMFGGTPVYFIRWNPDGYTCDKMVPEKVGMRHKRVGDLLLSISEGRVKLPNALVAAHYMYYDGWSHNDDLKWELLTAFEGEGA